MFKIKILSVGKTKETWLSEAIEEYAKRLTAVASLEFIWAKNDEQLLTFISQESGVICLDAEGSLMSSEQFSSFLEDQLVKQGSRLAFVIGGSEGLPLSIKRQFPLLSLSRMTLTHQITRLVLIEQIYRAFEILKGSKYHK